MAAARIKVAMDPLEMAQSAESAANLLRALAHPGRLILLCQLVGGEKNVGELEALTDLHQPTLSQQIGILRNEGLILPRRDGRHMYYSVADPVVLKLLNVLYDSYCAAK
jgi:ArsR family transcriptional regulator